MEYISGDLCDLEKLKQAFHGATVVYHIAALVANYGQMEKFMHSNVFATQNVIDACYHCGVHKLIFTGSYSALHYGDLNYIDESYPYPEKTYDNYAKSKQLAEQIVLEANNTNGLQTCVIVLPAIWGPGDRQLYEYFEKLKLNVCLGDGKNLIGGCYIDNVVEGLLLAEEHMYLGSKVGGEKFFVTDERPRTLLEICKGFASIFVGTEKLYFIPLWLVWIGACLLEYSHWLLDTVYDFKPIFTTSIYHYSTGNYTFNISKAKELLHYKPIVSVEQGLEACREYHERKLKQANQAREAPQ